MERIERVLGGLFGVACGDALGATLEFINSEVGRKVYGYHKEIIGGGVMNVAAGEATDDTAMTVAVAKGILDNPLQPVENIGKEFVNWYNTRPKDIGVTCSYAIGRYLKVNDWDKASLYAHEMCDGRSAGNGSLMRCIPSALYYRDFELMSKVTKAQSKMTHFDNKAAEACMLYNNLVFRFLQEDRKFKAINEVVSSYKLYKSVFDLRKQDLNPSGYVVDSLLCALWCFINFDSPEEIICEAVNLYGDPDTIGAIAGGLAGAYYGFSKIPERWREKLLIKDELMELGKKLSEPVM